MNGTMTPSHTIVHNISSIPCVKSMWHFKYWRLYGWIEQMWHLKHRRLYGWMEVVDEAVHDDHGPTWNKCHRRLHCIDGQNVEHKMTLRSNWATFKLMDAKLSEVLVSMIGMAGYMWLITSNITEIVQINYETYINVDCDHWHLLLYLQTTYRYALLKHVFLG